ncbi:LOW QUALITY PROTEIN: steroid 21-hydroxylase [Aquila chrysaetos chrysaetos]|uniref:LOW QUALITY PROTEIN: steroid 21-hydroxylase n=1 Tax=Aquila chrysaetos chrysaetos TaxID=223781 RepID=UPI001176D100|nr:LOW QUALITY PROTEIN: steroid 21-hydroxylase [Aquila chrysaetos chrysaetos]
MAAALVLALLVLLVLLGAGRRRGAGRGAGPAEGRGPRGGALHLLHPQGALHLRRLARRHGPVLRMRLGGRDLLVLSSVGTIREALARHWGDWLERPPSYLGGLVSRGGRDLALGAATPGWRRQRGVTRGALARAGGRLRPLLRRQAGALCAELHSHGGAPLDPFEVFSFYTCSTIGHLLFGDLMPPEAEVRAFTRCVVELLEVWGRGSVRVLDLLPALRVLPNPGLRELLRLVELRDAFVEAQIRRHEECPSPPGDTVLAALQGRDPGVQGGPLSPPRLHMALVDLFIGGTETTAAALAWAVAFLLHRPELQERLRAELWRELGPTGTPQAGDTGRLPLLHATVTETLRLRPPAPLALPHCARRHTSVGGIPVPAGSILIPNLLAAQQDPDTWHHPEAFLPERFLVPGAPWRALVPFGCGARSCLGEGLARAELFVFLGRILQEFRLEPPAPGVLPCLEVSAGTVLRCPPFRVRMVPCQPPA